MQTIVSGGFQNPKIVVFKVLAFKPHLRFWSIRYFVFWRFSSPGYICSAIIVSAITFMMYPTMLSNVCCKEVRWRSFSFARILIIESFSCIGLGDGSSSSDSSTFFSVSDWSSSQWKKSFLSSSVGWPHFVKNFIKLIKIAFGRVLNPEDYN